MRELRTYGPVPKITRSFGMDFTVTAVNDVSQGVVDVFDSFGRFIPTPFYHWNILVNNALYNSARLKYPGISDKAAYEQAICLFCSNFHYWYLGLN